MQRRELENLVEKYANVESSTRLILLSDVSQSGKIEMGAAFKADEIRLTQVVRSTQRIVCGASMFSKADADVVASHEAEGPPLRTFLWPLQNEEQKMHEYAQVVAEKAFRVRFRDQN